MFFDNQKTVVKINKIRYIAILVYVALVSIIFFSGWFDDQILGLSKTSFIVVLSALYILYIIVSYLLNFNFFSFSDEGNKLVFKFISFRPFDNAKKAIEIEKGKFSGYKIEKSFFNMKKELILSIKTKNGVAKFPSISISALSEENLTLLKSSLNQFV